MEWKNLGNGKPLNDSEILVYSSFSEKYYIEYVDSEFWIRVSRLDYTHYRLLSKPTIKQEKNTTELYIEFLEELKQHSFEEAKKMIENNDNSEVANSLYMAYSIALIKAKELLN